MKVVNSIKGTVTTFTIDNERLFASITPGHCLRILSGGDYIEGSENIPTYPSVCYLTSKNIFATRGYNKEIYFIPKLLKEGEHSIECTLYDGEIYTSEKPNLVERM